MGDVGSVRYEVKTYWSNGCYAVVDLLSWRQLVLLGLESHDCKLLLFQGTIKILILLVPHEIYWSWAEG